MGDELEALLTGIGVVEAGTGLRGGEGDVVDGLGTFGCLEQHAGVVQALFKIEIDATNR